MIESLDANRRTCFSSGFFSFFLSFFFFFLDGDLIDVGGSQKRVQEREKVAEPSPESRRGGKECKGPGRARSPTSLTGKVGQQAPDASLWVTVTVTSEGQHALHAPWRPCSTSAITSAARHRLLPLV